MKMNRKEESMKDSKLQEWTEKWSYTAKKIKKSKKHTKKSGSKSEYTV